MKGRGKKIDPVDRLVRLVKKWLDENVWSDDSASMRRWDRLSDAVDAVERSRRKRTGEKKKWVN